MLKPKKSIKISTFNSRTLREEWQFEELLECMSKNGIAIIGVQEHRRVSENDITFASRNGYHLITSTAWINIQQAATGGVGVVLSKNAESALCKVESVWLSRDNYYSCLFANQFNNEQVEVFYEDLRKAIDYTPPHHFLSILGDMNAKVSAAHVKYA